MYSIIFLGTPKMSADFLRKLILWNKVEIKACITQPDNPFKKGDKALSEVAKVAREYNIPCYKVEKLNKDYQFIIDLKPDLLLTFAYGQIISTNVLNLSKFKALNLHGSILPSYRGAAPIQYSLFNGDKETGVSLMAMEKGVDCGEVYAIRKFSIDEDDNYTSLCDKMSENAFKLVEEKLLSFFEGKLIGQKQNDDLATFTSMIKKEQEHLDLTKSVDNLINSIRALSYQPGGYLLLNDEKIKIYRARKVNDLVTASIGEVVSTNKELVVQGSDGQFEVLQLKREGKNMVDGRSFVNGYEIKGKIFK